jgi:LacI family transcriptional regulator
LRCKCALATIEIILKKTTTSISIGQLSRELKLSASTVSRALRDHPAISSDTIARVQKAAELHGYKPKESLNRYFKALRGEVSGVAFLVDNTVQERLSLRDPFYSQILWSVERALQKTGTHMILSNVRSNLTSSGSLYAIEEGMANGVIIESQDTAMIAKLAQHTSVVVLNSDPRGQNVDSVIPDIERAARSQMDCLVELGHRRIANFRLKPPTGTPFSHWQDRAFWREYADYSQDIGLEIPQSWMEPIAFNSENEIEAIGAFLDRILAGDRATAILTYDTYAGELIRQLANRGLSVPGDISIMGFDDDIHGRFCPMPLATFRQDFDAMATEAVRLVRERASNPSRAPLMVKVEGKVIVRESVGAARKF